MDDDLEKSRKTRLVEDTAAVMYAYPNSRLEKRVPNEEMKAVLAVFGATIVSEVSAADEPAFRRYLNARMSGFRFP